MGVGRGRPARGVPGLGEHLRPAQPDPVPSPLDASLVRHPPPRRPRPDRRAARRPPRRAGVDRGPAPHPAVRTDDPEVAQALLDDALATGHEGVMVKALASPYAAGRRGQGVAQDQAGPHARPRGARGRVGVGPPPGLLSNLHLGALGADGAPVMVGKTFKGLTDELLAWQTAAVPRARDAPGRPRRLRPARAGGRDRARRRAGIDPLSRRRGAAVRPGAALPRRQGPRPTPTPSTRSAPCSPAPAAERPPGGQSTRWNSIR